MRNLNRLSRAGFAGLVCTNNEVGFSHGRRHLVSVATIVRLGITDDYENMDPRLVGLFEKLVPPHSGIQLKQGQDPDAGG